MGIAMVAHATNGVVGPGNCNEAGFASVLATVDNSGGGTVTFDCGTATITFTSYKQIANAVVIDGGGHITFDGGNASAFFQVFASAAVTLRNLTLQHGILHDVHAVENFGALTLNRVRMISNSSTESAVMNFGSATVFDSTFTGNVASSSSNGHGGAIGNLGTLLDVSSSTFNGNSATLGAAIYSEADLSVTNSTFSANTGTNGGGSIYQAVGGNAVIKFVTIVGNTAPFGAGLYNDGGGSSTMTVGASIVSANTTGNCDGVIQSSGYNLSNDMGCGSAFTGPGDVINTTLNMQPLANYGGPTQTQPPQPGNPAIDHVPLSACSEPFDQRAGARPFGALCDSGSVELGSAADDLIFADGFDPD
jgi:predicted outer membrane repeat protein